MTNCEHDPTDICKSCNQTIREGGTVALLPAEKPKASKKAKPEPEPDAPEPEVHAGRGDSWP